MYSIQELIDVALKEDIGSGDITTENLVDSNCRGKGRLVAKENFVLAGLEVAKSVFKTLDPDTVFHHDCSDGDMVDSGDVIMACEGKLRYLLMGERTALNFLQHLSGVATCVRAYVDAIGNSHVRLVDTRKTIPGFRVLEKYAVRMGGARNHRMGLYDAVLIKDNHIAVSGGIGAAIEKVRDQVSHLEKIEVEVSDLAGVSEAIAAGAEVIMLDNMDVDQITEAVALIDGKAIVEVSGGITRDNVKLLAGTGVDIISVGALTHSAGSVDISMYIDVL